MTMKDSFNGSTTTTLGDTNRNTLLTCIATGISVKLLRKLRKEQFSHETMALIPLDESEKESLPNGCTKKTTDKNSNNLNK